MNYVINRMEMTHVGGTKSYTIITITNTNTGHALFVTRWGKIGQFGQIKVERCFDDKTLLVSADDDLASKMKTKLREKLRNGYKDAPLTTLTIDSASDIIGNIGASYWYYLGKDNVEFLCGSDLTAKDLEKIRRPDIISASLTNEAVTVVETISSREETIKHNVAINVNWGMF